MPLRGTRVALYARYSSDRQSENSIADQMRICREHAERQGWTVIHAFHDAAISGTSLDRPGYQALQQAMRWIAFRGARTTPPGFTSW